MSGSSSPDKPPLFGGPVLIGLAVAAIVAAVLIGIGVSHGLDSEFRLEAAKAGLNLIVLAVIGAGVTAAVQRAAQDREERQRGEAEDRETARQQFAERQEARRRDSDYALGVLRGIIVNYNSLKAARRALRAVGLDKLDKLESKVITPAQAEEFERQMQNLGEVQLAFEAIQRELDTRLDPDAVEGSDEPGAAAPSGHKLAIEHLASYVEQIVKEWECHGRHVNPGDDPEVIASRKRLQAFLVSSREDALREFRAYAAEPLLELQLFFRQRLLVPLLRDEPVGDGTPVGEHSPARPV